MTRPRIRVPGSVPLVVAACLAGSAATAPAAGDPVPLQRGAKADGRAVVSFVGFEPGKNGSARITVELDRAVTVTKTGATNRLTLRMAQARIPTRNNKNPLVTAHFASVVASVRLVQSGNDVDLVVELREAAEGAHRLTEKVGGAVLAVDFPPPSLRPKESP